MLKEGGFHLQGREQAVGSLHYPDHVLLQEGLVRVDIDS